MATIVFTEEEKAAAENALEEQLLKNARLGNHQAQLLLATKYLENGSENEAKKWFRKALNSDDRDIVKAAKEGLEQCGGVGILYTIKRIFKISKMVIKIAIILAIVLIIIAIVF